MIIPEEERKSIMSMMQMRRTCPRCKKKYTFNPDLGKMFCPRCGPISEPGMGDVPGTTPPIDIRDIFKRRKDK